MSDDELVGRAVAAMTRKMIETGSSFGSSREAIEILARAAIAEVQRWRPIAEAPKIECRRLWLWQRGRGGYEGWWHDFGPYGQDWQDDSDSEPAPTHWQPRPAPPQ